MDSPGKDRPEQVEINDSEAEKTFLLENALDAVVSVDESNRVTFWNKNAERIFGWTKAEIMGHDMTEMIVPEHLRERHRNGLRRFVETGVSRIQNQRIEITGLRKNGEQFLMELTVSSVKSGAGYRFYSFMRDINEQKRAEQKLRESEDGLKVALAQAKLKEDELLRSETHLRAAIDSSAGGFYGVDTQGVTTVCNSAFLRMLGFERLTDAVGNRLHDVIHHTHPDGRPYPKEECPIYRAAQTGTPSHVLDELFFRLDGTSFPVEYWTLPLVHNGELQGAVTTFIDITDRKVGEQALRAAKEEAEKANQLKSAFLANMSHEIRTPLGAMLGFADLLRDRGLTEAERSNYTDILTRNGEQLSVIINDILDLSKVEAGHLTLEYSDANPEQIAAEVLSLLRVKAKEKGLGLELNVDESTPAVIVSDSTRMRQVLLNLVSNAVKFTQAGSVKLKVYARRSSSNQASVCFEVTDTGIGIAQGQQDKIFQVFVQADGSMTRRFGGTGLGLTLSRSLARALGGDVTLVASKEQQGSCFLFQVKDEAEKRVPTTVVNREEGASDFKISGGLLNDKRILVVDDSPDNRQLICHYLTKCGALVDTADNGLSGYRKAIAGEPDLVLMDIQMPEMDGYTAAQKLRGAGFRKPIIALTAHAMDDVRRKCLNIGCNDHLSKPINSIQLISTVLKYTQSNNQ